MAIGSHKVRLKGYHHCSCLHVSTVSLDAQSSFAHSKSFLTLSLCSPLSVSILLVTCR